MLLPIAGCKLNTNTDYSAYFRTARPTKVDDLKVLFKGRVDVVPLADLVAGDYAEALEGMHPDFVASRCFVDPA